MPAHRSTAVHPIFGLAPLHTTLLMLQSHALLSCCIAVLIQACKCVSKQVIYTLLSCYVSCELELMTIAKLEKLI